MRHVVFALIALAACAEDSPPCDFDEHIYSYETSPISGSCGKLDPSLILPGACPQRVLPATGTCARARESVCTTPQGSVLAVSVLHREDDDSSYTGTIDITASDAQGTVVCKATYSIRLEQQ